MYHLNGLVICRGTTLEYTPDADESRAGAVVLENALTDNEKAMTGMGTKVLIWPDKKAFDTVSGELTDLAAAWTLSGGTMTVTPCDGEGRTYAPDGVGTTEPESPADGQLFLKGDAESPYGAGSVLLKYSAKNKKWSEILLTSLRLHCPGLGSVLKEGDTVTVSGMPGTVCSAAAAGLNGEVSISTLDGDDVITTLAVPEDSTRYYGSWTVTATGTSWRSADGKVTENEAAAAPVKLERRVPDLDFVTEQGNRVWGCSREENSIYACALGDPTNWYSYRGIASDSYAVSVGSDGAFTGAASCLGYLLFFKENCIHKLYGSKPSDYQMSSVRCRGVAANAAGSLCVIAETLYYLSPDGVMAWSGSLPAKVSGALDTGKLTAVDRAVGGQLDARYYLYTRVPQATGTRARLLVYDTERKLWHEEDTGDGQKTAGWEMCSTRQQLYLWDGEALWAAEPDRESDRETDEAQAAVEKKVDFTATTGDIGLTGPDDKYVSRVTLRVDALAYSVVRVQASYDGGAWETLGDAAVLNRWVRVNLPFVPARHDTLRLRISGTGQIAVRSIAFTFAASRGNRVAGA